MGTSPPPAAAFDSLFGGGLQSKQEAEDPLLGGVPTQITADAEYFGLRDDWPQTVAEARAHLGLPPKEESDDDDDDDADHDDGDEQPWMPLTVAEARVQLGLPPSFAYLGLAPKIAMGSTIPFLKTYMPPSGRFRCSDSSSRSSLPTHLRSFQALGRSQKTRSSVPGEDEMARQLRSLCLKIDGGAARAGARRCTPS